MQSTDRGEKPRMQTHTHTNAHTPSSWRLKHLQLAKKNEINIVAVNFSNM